MNTNKRTYSPDEYYLIKKIDAKKFMLEADEYVLANPVLRDQEEVIINNREAVVTPIEGLQFFGPEDDLE